MHLNCISGSPLLVEQLLGCQLEDLCKRLDASNMGSKNWRDLAVYVGAEQVEICHWETAFKRDKSPTICVINYMKSQEMTACQLKNSLIGIGRRDVARDFSEHLFTGCRICHHRIAYRPRRIRITSGNSTPV